MSVIGAKGFAVGVQWHPEYWAKTDAPSAALFKAFGDAVRDHAAAHHHQATRTTGLGGCGARLRALLESHEGTLGGSGFGDGRLVLRSSNVWLTVLRARL